MYQGKVGLHCTKLMKDYALNCDSCRRNLLFKSFLCYSHDIADVACKCCDDHAHVVIVNHNYFFNCTIHVCVTKSITVFMR